MYQISIFNAGQAYVHDKDFPEKCPWCEKIVNFKFVYGKGVRIAQSTQTVVVLHCPSSACDRLTTVFVEGKDKSVYPLYQTKTAFSEDIKQLSPDFIEIYRQAARAKESGLDEICGPGFRKALEFLVKDYLIKFKKKDEETIKKLELQKCVQTFDNHYVKQLAEKCVWLGNDETHYERRWKTKDIEDLVNLTNLVVRHIDDEVYGEKVLAEMSKPAKGNK